MLWHASICCITRGREGAVKTILPGNIPIVYTKRQIIQNLMCKIRNLIAIQYTPINVHLKHFRER